MDLSYLSNFYIRLPVILRLLLPPDVYKRQPEIGEDFPEIFREIVKINTLDYKKYQKIQQTIIDTLDTCEWVEIKGKGENETDLLIHLHTLTDAKTQDVYKRQT